MRFLFAFILVLTVIIWWNPLNKFTESRYIGKRIVREGSDPQSDIVEEELPPNIRAIFPDTMVTKDYRPDRLNLYVDELGYVYKQEYG